MTLSANPFVSIVIPARDEGPWVRRTVEAVLERSSSYPLEVVVVDDGSSDGSCDFLREGNWNGSVRLVLGEGVSLARARNLGAVQARGEVLVFLDAHVIPDHGWLEEMVLLLRDPSVGLATVGVSNLEEPQSVGYTYTFVNENLGSGWVPPRSSEPYETPCVCGCCMGVRSGLFHEIGGFDPGHVRYGVDIEISLRTWLLGYRCMASPRVQVAHYFKKGKDRKFSICWEEYDVNLLRCLFTCFSAESTEAILFGLQHRESFQRSLARVNADNDFWKRRDDLRRRFCRDETWYFDKFAKELEAFQRRLQELKDERGDKMVSETLQIVCPRCGGINVGIQTHCLLCHALLPVKAALSQEDSGVPESVTVVPQPVIARCPACGEVIMPGQRFCEGCGAALAAPGEKVAGATCPKCNAPLQSDAKFCEECGAIVEMAQPAPPQPAQTPLRSAPKPAQAGPVKPPQKPGFSTLNRLRSQTASLLTKAKEGRRIWLLLLLVPLLLVPLVCLAWMFWPESVPEGMVKFDDDNIGMTFNYPDTWKIVAQESNNVVLEDPATGTKVQILNDYNLPDQPLLEDYVDYYWQIYLQRYPNLETVQEGYENSLLNTPAYYHAGVIEDEGLNIIFIGGEHNGEYFSIITYGTGRYPLDAIDIVLADFHKR